MGAYYQDGSAQAQAELRALHLFSTNGSSDEEVDDLIAREM